MNKKITLLSGPRQTGKTTLSKNLRSDFDYLNFDNPDDFEMIKQRSWDRNKEHLILDEIHKMKDWKRWVKGVFDTEGIPPAMTITGSSRLETYKKFGDSLAGRFFHYRLHPFDVKELLLMDSDLDRDEVVDRLLSFGGFPEPYLEGTPNFYGRWKKTHLDIILRQDLIDQQSVHDIRSIELLIELLQKRVGSPISYTSLAEDLHVADKTIKKWLSVLEDMYVVFKVVPFHKNIARSNKKKPKYYFFDNARVKGDEGARLENLVACSLLKECHFRQDCLGENVDLFYLAKNGGQEVDFLITKNDHPHLMVEVKLSDSNLSKNFKVFMKDLPIPAVQLVQNLRREKTFPDGPEIRKLSSWLAKMDW